MNIIDFLFPKQCIFCSRIGYEICPTCHTKLIRSLPSCCICKKISKDYWTHDECINGKIQCFTGWYISKDISSTLERRKSIGIYSTYLHLLNELIESFQLTEYIQNSTVLPIPSKDISTKKLNQYLSKTIHSGESNSLNLLFIGESVGDVKDILKGLPLWKPFNIKILSLFTSTQSEAPHHSR
jgi:hypothetical protein